MTSPNFTRRFVSTCAITLISCAIANAQITSTIDYIPSGVETVLSTDFTQITPVGGPPINVAGGIFVFRDVTIPAGRTVRGVGSRPMVWIVTGRMTIDGTLSVNGGNGQRVDTLSAANFVAAGGVGVCTGGDGGLGSPQTSSRSFFAQAGQGAFQVMGIGGQPGQIFCLGGSGTGSGGGGGVFGTTGDPSYPASPVANLRASGVGGSVAPSAPGGQPGISPFLDGNSNNDFVGFGFDGSAGQFVQGELLRLRGGQGGGGGGDKSTQCSAHDPMFFRDAKGGGGGGGGGCLLIYAIGGLEIGPQGIVSADGGHGGGGEQAGSNSHGGGGGGGSGGMVILASPLEIVLHTHGETFANDDFDFAVSADGGVSLQGGFLSQPVFDKYSGINRGSASNSNARATGGFGGLGVIQFITRVGHNQDGTNTHFDDFIRIVDANGQDLMGADKQRYIAWRGYQDATGTGVDDFGNPTNIGRDEGDIRPSPYLLPLLGL